MAYQATAAAAVGLVAVHMLALMAPCPSSAAWGWQVTAKDAPEITALMENALWSCAETLVGIDGKVSDEYRKANNLEYASPQMAEYFSGNCKCTVVPKPGYKCDRAETLLVGNAKAVHKNLKEGDQILPPRLGPDCTNNGYPGADIDCRLTWQHEPQCSKDDAGKGKDDAGKGGCCSCM